VGGVVLDTGRRAWTPLWSSMVVLVAGLSVCVQVSSYFFCGVIGGGGRSPAYTAWV
jgi:hypothetical protein